MENWESDIGEWHTMDKDLAALLVSQSDKLLDGKNAVADSITDKTMRIFPIVITVDSALIAFVAEKWNFSFPIESPSVAIALVSILILTFSAGFLYKNLRKFQVKLSGEYPSTMATSKNVDGFEGCEYNAFVLWLIGGTERSIRFVDRSNAKRLKNVDNAIRTLALLPIAAIIILFLYALG